MEENPNDGFPIEVGPLCLVTLVARVALMALVARMGLLAFLILVAVNF